jgi:hypothetical protein
MEKDISQMIAKRIQPPEKIIQTVSKHKKRAVLIAMLKPEMEHIRGKKLRDMPETFDVGVIDNQRLLVIEEAVAEGIKIEGENEDKKIKVG